MNERINIDINFAAIFHNIVKRLWLIILCAVVAASAAYVYITFFVQPLYSSTATLYVGNTTGGINNSEVILSESLAKDYEVIIKRRAILDDVVHKLDLKMSAAQLRNCISVTNVSDTRILDITVSTADPALSKNIADTICNVASAKFVDIVQVDYVSIVDTGSIGTVPSNINLKMSMFLAAFAGALACALIIIVRTLMDDKIKTPDDVERYLGLSVLGTTPFSKEFESDNTRNKSSRKKKRSKK